MNAHLRHGESAHLVPEHEDPKALARALERVCEDADYAAALGQSATRAAEPFARDAVQRLEADHPELTLEKLLAEG